VSFPTPAQQASGNPDLMIQRITLIYARILSIEALQRLVSRSRFARRE
jgi:hypothetical protein